MRPAEATRNVRLSADLVEMLLALAWAQRASAAEVADATVRKAVKAKFDLLPTEFREPALARIAKLPAGKPTPNK